MSQTTHAAAQVEVMAAGVPQGIGWPLTNPEDSRNSAKAIEKADLKQRIGE